MHSKQTGKTAYSDFGPIKVNVPWPQKLLLSRLQRRRMNLQTVAVTVAENLPETLNSLSLNFAHCKIRGALAVAEHLPKDLSSLDLNLEGCDLHYLSKPQNEAGRLHQRIPQRIAGVQALAERLPGKLTSLSLNFKGCSIDDEGAEAIATHLPAGLSGLAFQIPVIWKLILF